MSDKSDGLDFDRQAFVRPETPTRSAPPKGWITGVFLFLAVIAAIVLGYKLLPLIMEGPANPGDPELAQLDQRLTAIEGRLDKLEAARRAVVSGKKDKDEDVDSREAPLKPSARTVYQISPAQTQQAHAVPTPLSSSEPAIAEHLSSLQRDVGGLENSDAANREAWQAMTDRIADMTGQVGTQGAEIIQNRDQLSQLLARSQMEAIPFELLRGANPQPVGPVSLQLQSSNPKSQRYSLCVYIQPSCVELKDRTLHEVVQFVISRDSAPLEVIATKITKNQVLGYLEVPRSQNKTLAIR
jgi:hypothetical protein